MDVNPDCCGLLGLTPKYRYGSVWTERGNGENFKAHHDEHNQLTQIYINKAIKEGWELHSINESAAMNETQRWLSTAFCWVIWPEEESNEEEEEDQTT